MAMPARLGAPDRKSLLLGTAIVSLGLLGSGLAPAPAQAQVNCIDGVTVPFPPGPIDLSENDSIVCENDGPRDNILGNAIDLDTIGNGNFIDLDNSGDLTAFDNGISTQTAGENAFISIGNSGEIDVGGVGIYAYTLGTADAIGPGADASIVIGNTADVDSGSTSIYARTFGDADGEDSTAGVFIANTGNLDSDDGDGVRAFSYGEATGDNGDASVIVRNTGKIDADEDGINASAFGAAIGENSKSSVTVHNSGDIDAPSESGYGIRTLTEGEASGEGSDKSITVRNSGDIDVRNFGIEGKTYGDASGENSSAAISIHNTGNIVTGDGEPDGGADGIRADVYGTRSGEGADTSILVKNWGDIDAADDGISVANRNEELSDDITVYNYGDITANEDGIQTYQRSEAGGGDTKVHNEGDLRISSTEDGGDDAIGIFSNVYGVDSAIEIHNSGDMWVSSTGTGTDAFGIQALASLDGSPIAVRNSGDHKVTSAESGYGIRVRAEGVGSTATVVNSGALEVIGTGNNARGIDVATEVGDAPARVDNSGDIDAFGVEQVTGIRVRTTGPGSLIDIHNSGALKVESSEAGPTEEVRGIEAETTSENSRIDIANSGDIEVTARGVGDSGEADGIRAYAEASNSDVKIDNSGDIDVTALEEEISGDGIDANTNGDNSDIEIWNSGALTTTTVSSGADGIDADSDGDNSAVTVRNSGAIVVEVSEGESSADGIDADSNGENSAVKVVNSGDMDIKIRGGDGNSADGIDAEADGDNSDIEVWNSGDMRVLATNGGGSTAGIEADTGISGPYGPYGPYAYGDGSSIKITNHGDLTVTTKGDGARTEGIGAETEGDNAEIEITNTGDLHAEARGGGDAEAFGISADSYGENSPIDIENSGSVYAKGGYRNVGIRAYSTYANKTTITNTGTVGAESHRAIDVKGAGTAHIDNAGTVTGFVDLTSQDDVFNNQSGGVFEAKKTSLFGAGEDLFVNRGGGTVQAATNGKKSEKTFFEGLETFKNAGLISMVDAKEGDAFTISNTPGGTDLDYKGGGTLGVDSFLGGPGSKSDIFTIEGNVSGKTKVAVYNTNQGGGVFNDKGIPVVFATGATPDANAFRLQDGPIDAGFFNYDLFFEPTGSGQWELRSFAGGGAHLLPQLLTAAQDIWHQSSSTWFDRTADLRVLMHGGPAPAAYSDKSLGVAPPQEQLAPAVWLKGGGSWLDRDANATTSAYGRNYKFNLDRELETIDVQVGIDFASRDVLGAGDALVFGVLGGFVHGDLDYDGLARRFTYSGGQVGAYATYLSGGLFVDTLLNVHLTELDTNTRGFADSLDANTVGLRTDAGYRFGSFSGGAFIEPLGTIEVMWADIDGFSQDGNRVSFDDDANVRGRLGLRAGTTSEVWEGTLMEPFIIGSLWSNLSGDNQATLVSSGRTFQFQDNLEDVWGEVSAGVNFFNLSQTTSVFGKVDVTFGDDVTGLGGKAGMRVAW